MLLMVEPSSCSAARCRWGFPQHTCRRRRGLRDPIQLPSAFGRSKDADVPSCCSFRLVCLLIITHFKYPGMLIGTRCRWGAAAAHNHIVFLACVDERVVSHTTACGWRRLWSIPVTSILWRKRYQFSQFGICLSESLKSGVDSRPSRASLFTGVFRMML